MGEGLVSVISNQKGGGVVFKMHCCAVCVCLVVLVGGAVLFRSSDSVLSTTAIFPKKEGRKREISNDSARGSSLRKANV